ncbi:MAG: tetratricopeptide repeat protein [Phycisphaeraceae bacterium]
MRSTIRTCGLLATGLFVLTLAGCQSGGDTNHAKAVNAANVRWREMRTAMVLQMAQRQFDTGDLEQAEKSLTDALNTDPSNAGLYLLAGRIQIERGQLERAYQFLEVSIKYNPALAPAYYYQGMILERWQKFDQALDRYTQAYQRRADDPAYLLARCEMLVALDRLDDAEQELLDKMAYFDQNAGVRVGLAHVYLLQARPADAADLFYKASLMRPEDKQIVENLAAAQLAAGQFDKAVITLQRMAQQPDFEKRADLQRALAGAYEHTGRPMDAKTIYLKLTRRDPSDVDAWQRLGTVCWAMGDLQGTQLAASRIMALAPRQYDGYLLAGLVAKKRGDVDQALRVLDRAADLAPDSALPLVLRGLTLEQAGRDAAAAQAYSEALRRQPDDSQARQLLAKLESK